MSSGNKQLDQRQDDQWDACASGELTHMVHRLDVSQRRARRKQVYKTALISTAVFACVVVAIGSLAGPAGSHYGGISCAQCRDRLAEYYPHAAGELVLEDASFVASMATHLEKCIFCRDKFNALYPGLRAAKNDTTRPAIVVAFQPIFAIGQLSAAY